MQPQLRGKAIPDKYVVMELLSSEYGWTPNEIRQIPKYEIDIYVKIINNKRLIEHSIIKKNGDK